MSHAVDGLKTAELLRKAYATLHGIPTEPIDLVADGGPENNNGEVERLLEPLPMKKLIAQVGFVCSNSMIEAMNKILKYQYLFQKPISDVDHLSEAVKEPLEDFDDHANHKQHGLSPNEAYAGKVFDRAAYHERIVEAGIERRAVNRNACPPCVPIEDLHGTTQPACKESE